MLYVAVVCFHCFKLFHGVIYHILFIYFYCSWTFGVVCRFLLLEIMLL